MKITTQRQGLVARLGIVSRAVSTRATTQALGGILLSSEGGKLALRATDLEMSLQTDLEGDVDADGSVLLPGRQLVEVARSLGVDEVTIETREAERDVELCSGSAVFHLRTLPTEDFPQFPAPTDEPLRIPAAAFAATVELVARAASRDDMRPVLTGVLVSAADRQMTMVATDSYRLSVKRTELETEVGGELEANVPARALRELARILVGEEAETVEISLLSNQAVFVAGRVVLTTRLIEGQFPSHTQLLPESYDHDVRLPREEFLEVTRRVSQLAQRNAPLRLSFKSGELTVAAETPEVGDATETMPAAFEGEPLEIGFNPEFLKDGIDSVEGDELLLRLISPLRPGLLQPGEGEDYRYLVMPIRLNV
ncbi:MAG TPA: DNA polymerase III subunit beta [Solirubrobacterales bacterium]